MATIASKLPLARKGAANSATSSKTMGGRSCSLADMRAERDRRKSTGSGGDGSSIETHALIGWFNTELLPKILAIETGVQSMSNSMSTCLATVQHIKASQIESERLSPSKLRTPMPHASMPPSSVRRLHRRLPRDAGEWPEVQRPSWGELNVPGDANAGGEGLLYGVLSEPRSSRVPRRETQQLMSTSDLGSVDSGASPSSVLPVPGMGRRISPTTPSEANNRHTMMSISSGELRGSSNRLHPEERTSIRPQSFGSIVKKSASVTSFGSMLGRLRHAEERQGERAAQIWNFMENPESGVNARRFATWMPIFVVVTVLLTLFEAVEPQPNLSPFDFLENDILAAVVQTCVDIIFLLEVALRFACCPSRKAFFTSIYNIVDVAAALPLVPRLMVGCVLPTETDDSSRGVARHILLGIAPLLRLLKVLRYFKTFQLLFLAFKRVFEALPVLLFTQLLITLVFSPLIYFVEPRNNIQSLPTAIWLTLVTMTTVGYGDVVPSSLAGSAIVATLVVSSMIFVAFPLGIIGHTFTQVWRDRDRILLMQRTRDCLDHWGYTAREVQRLFSIADRDGDGELDLDEFRDLMHLMKIGLSDERVIALFKSFDYDFSGSINDEEFIWTLFPGADVRLRTPAPGGMGGEIEIEKSESDPDD
mmetsp:Transcript_49735/g.118560  ORF Transcript_49735/g.118560 Transcript_49735/m.118560 type:complete len:648 (-) Transcript_49735:198-2141(-)